MMVIVCYVYPATEKEDVLTVLYSLFYTNSWGIKAV